MVNIRTVLFFSPSLLSGKSGRKDGCVGPAPSHPRIIFNVIIGAAPFGFEQSSRVYAIPEIDRSARRKRRLLLHKYLVDLLIPRQPIDFLKKKKEEKRMDD